MNKTVKKLIAREGLIIASMIVFGIVTGVVGYIASETIDKQGSKIQNDFNITRSYPYPAYKLVFLSEDKKANFKKYTDSELKAISQLYRLDKISNAVQSVSTFFALTLLWCYPLYLLIRFGPSFIKLFKKKETAFLTGAIAAFVLSFALRHYYIQFIVLAIALFILHLKQRGN
ncbi:MAG: hypothetical protein WBC74_03480 [Candidatus Omnitrophota bacterium]